MLNDAIRSMSLKDDDPIDLPDNPCFRGRLLNHGIDDREKAEDMVYL